MRRDGTESKCRGGRRDGAGRRPDREVDRRALNVLVHEAAGDTRKLATDRVAIAEQPHAWQVVLDVLAALRERIDLRLNAKIDTALDDGLDTLHEVLLGDCALHLRGNEPNRLAREFDLLDAVRERVDKTCDRRWPGWGYAITADVSASDASMSTVYSGWPLPEIVAAGTAPLCPGCAADPFSHWHCEECGRPVPACVPPRLGLLDDRLRATRATWTCSDACDARVRKRAG